MKVKVLPRGFTHAHSLGSSSSVVSLVMPMRRCLRVPVLCLRVHVWPECPRVVTSHGPFDTEGHRGPVSEGKLSDQA